MTPLSKHPYSHLYLKTESPRIDDARMRLRASSLTQEILKAEKIDSYAIGKHLELKMGIRILEEGYSGFYVRWDEFFHRASVSDVLDAFFHIAYYYREVRNSPGKAKRYCQLVEEILREREMAYRIDEDGTVHPFVDPEFSRAQTTLLRSLDGPRYESARHHIDRSEKSLLASSPDHRQALRSIFDAAENVFKLMFPGATQMNSSAIDKHLKSAIARQTEPGSIELRYLEKYRELLKNWVDALHNYRHEAGKAEPTQPSEVQAVLGISTGYALVRWLVEIDQELLK